jgi:hypothetical protein
VKTLQSARLNYFGNWIPELKRDPVRAQEQPQKEKAMGCAPSWRFLLCDGGKDLRQLHGKSGARHDFVKAGRLRFCRKVRLYVGKEANHADIGLRGAQALDRIERRGFRVEIDDDEGGRRIEELEEGNGVGGNLDLQSEVLGGFSQLHLKEEIVHVGYDARHRSQAPESGKRHRC